MSEIPANFVELARTSPYLDLLGPIYQKTSESGLVVGLRIAEKHCNARNRLHGGVVSGLADITLGYSMAFASGEPRPLVTTSLSVDFAGSANCGDWLEVHTDIQKMGRTMAFANCYFLVGSERIARASGVFLDVSSLGRN